MTLKVRLIPCLDVKDRASARSEARTDKTDKGGRPVTLRNGSR